MWDKSYWTEALRWQMVIRTSDLWLKVNSIKIRRTGMNSLLPSLKRLKFAQHKNQPKIKSVRVNGQITEVKPGHYWDGLHYTKHRLRRIVVILLANLPSLPKKLGVSNRQMQLICLICPRESINLIGGLLGHVCQHDLYI